MGVFDAAQQVVNQSAGVIIGNTNIDIDSLVGDLQTSLEAMSLGGLIGLWFQSLFVGLSMNILSICIMLVVYGRMIEIYRASRSAAFHPKVVRGHFGNPALASR